MADEDQGDWLEAGGPKAMKGQIFTKHALGKIIGATPKTMDKLIRDGMPVVERGSRTSPSKLNSADVIAWLRRRDVELATGDEEALSFEAAKRRDKEAQAHLRELQIKKREGDLVEVERVIRHIGRVAGAIRSGLLSVSSQVDGLTDEQREQLDSAIYDTLAELSGEKAGDWLEGNVDDDFEGDDDSSESSGEDDSSF